MNLHKLDLFKTTKEKPVLNLYSYTGGVVSCVETMVSNTYNSFSSKPNSFKYIFFF